MTQTIPSIGMAELHAVRYDFIVSPIRNWHHAVKAVEHHFLDTNQREAART